MRIKNTPRGMLLNGDALNLSVNIIKDMLWLDSSPNAKYTDKTITNYLLIPVLLKPALTRLVIIVLVLLQKEPLDKCFVIVIGMKFNRLLIRSWKNNAVKTVENPWFSDNQNRRFWKYYWGSIDICYWFR